MSKEHKQKANTFEKMTATPIPKLILTLSVPTVISMLVTNIYNLADTAFVSQLGNSASGAIGIVFGFMAIIQAIGFMFGQGSGSIISRLLGKKNIDEASHFASMAFYLSFFIALVVAIICFIYVEPLIYFLGSTPTIAPYAKTYVSFIILTMPFMVSSYTLNVILRFEGKAFLGMMGLMSGALINIAGDAVFMFGFKMGVAGAGLSTAISQVVSFCILISNFISGRSICKLSLKLIKFNWKDLGNIVATGVPSLLRQSLNSIATILLNSVAGAYGDAAIAAMSINSRIFFFMFSIALGIGQGFQPVCGFNYGAKNYKRVRDGFKFTFTLAQLIMLVFGIIVFSFAPQIIAIFRDDPVVIEIATRALRLMCCTGLLLPFCMTTEMTFQSSGYKLQAAIVSALRSGILFIPSIIILSKLRGLSGIEEAQPVSNIISFFPTIFFTTAFFKKLPKEDIKSEETKSE